MVLAFVLIRFVFFPTLSFVTGTTLPIVIVESCSMYHGTDFNTWWPRAESWYGQNNITKQEFESFKFSNGFSKGDIFFVFGTKKSDIKEGDIIIFASGTQGRPIIHRVISMNPLATKGDNNQRQFSLEDASLSNPEKIDETKIQESQLIGRAVGFKIPLMG